MLVAIETTRTSGVAFRKELDLEVTHHKVSVYGLDLLVEESVNRIVLELVDGVLERQEGVVHRNDRGVRVIQSGTEDETTDTAKSIDSKSDGHGEERESLALSFVISDKLQCARSSFLVFMTGRGGFFGRRIPISVLALGRGSHHRRRVSTIQRYQLSISADGQTHSGGHCTLFSRLNS